MTDRETAKNKLLGKFRSITLERLDKLNNLFLHVEQNPRNEAATQELMREIHTLKGEAKMMGFTHINHVAHSVEDLLLDAHAHHYAARAEVNDLILQGFDAINVLIRESGEVDVDRFVNRAKAVLAGGRASPDAPSAPAPTAEPRHHGSPATTTIPRIEAPPQRGPIATQAAASVRVSVKKLDDIAAIAGDLLLGQAQLESTLKSLTQLVEAWRHEGEQLRIHPVPTDTQVHNAHASQARAQVAQGFTFQNAVLRDITSIVSQARDNIFDNRVRLDDLDERVRELRFVPVSELFSRFQRAARDLASEQGKKALVSLVGSDVAVDSDVLDHISEPLLHLVRNCVDHGIEAPEERIRAGKTADGHIALSATQIGSLVELSIRDDGCGIDPEAIHTLAIERGLMSESERDAVADEQVLLLLFRPGFSTRVDVSEVSGRGIGLDVVKRKIEELGGAVALHSTPGHGTTFRLICPVSMILSRALVFAIGSGLYAVSSESVFVTLDVKNEDIDMVGTGRAFRLADTAIPLVELASVLGLPQGPQDTPPPSHPVVVLQQHGHRRGFLVTHLVGERQVLQRRLDPFLTGLRWINSTAVLEGGEFALLFNPTELMESVGESAVVQIHTAAPAHPTAARTILVVDDSEMTRDLIVGILQEAGFHVVDAANGAEAIAAIQRSAPDLVVTDLEMPEMDGFGLLTKVRASKRDNNIPVVVLTTRGTREDREKAEALGANAFLVKTNFREDALVRIIKNLVAD